MSNRINELLIPNVSKLPQHKSVDVSKRLGNENPNEFKNLLVGEMKEVEEQHGMNLSTHAAKRLHERNIEMDSDEFFKLRGAVDKLKSKGGRDSLIITDKAAYIVDVNKNTIVTAIDKNNMMENVFTKIDSTLVVS